MSHVEIRAASAPPRTPTYAWALAADVIAEAHPEGPTGEMRYGTRHFAPGARVYVLPTAYGVGHRAWVVGRHRGGSHSGWSRVVVPARLLTNWRVELVGGPRKVLGMLADHWDERTEGRAWEMAKRMLGDSSTKG